MGTAIKLLAGRDYSRAELAAKLQQRKFSSDEITACLDALVRRGFIAETGADRQALAAMAAVYLRKHQRTKTLAGRLHGLEAFLLRKGFDEHLVQQYLETAQDALSAGKSHGQEISNSE